MSFVCLWIPASPTGVEQDRRRDRHRDGSPLGSEAESEDAIELLRALLPALLGASPHVATETCDSGYMIWVDARGLSARRVAAEALRIARDCGARDSRAGVARTAVVAELAATAITNEVITRQSGRKAGEASQYVKGNASAHVSEHISEDYARLIVSVSPERERGFLASLHIAALTRAHRTSTRLAAALADVGIETCGDLAGLTQESVEVRFGAEGVSLWRLARADDQRRIFAPHARTLPTASLEWEEYALRDPERLIFVANRLVEVICAELRTWGEAARAMTLGIALVNRTAIERPIRAARGTASRAAWTRLIRAELDRVTLPDAVVGLSLRVDAVAGAEAPQGDLFDRGFESARSVEEALSQLIDDQRATVAGLTVSMHPLLEQRARWRVREIAEVLRTDTQEKARRNKKAGVSGGDSATHLYLVGSSLTAIPSTVTPGSVSASLPSAMDLDAALVLQLFPEPRRIAVVAGVRRGYHVPKRYRERYRERHHDGYRGRQSEADGDAGIEVEVIAAAGPDCVTGGDELGLSYAREYWHCFTSDDMFVLLFRDATKCEHKDVPGVWYLHGWWD